MTIKRVYFGEKTARDKIESETGRLARAFALVDRDNRPAPMVEQSPPKKQGFELSFISGW